MRRGLSLEAGNRACSFPTADYWLAIRFSNACSNPSRISVNEDYHVQEEKSFPALACC
jgi:hypothetical protein